MVWQPWELRNKHNVHKSTLSTKFIAPWWVIHKKALLHYWVNGSLFEMCIDNSPIRNMFSVAYPYLQMPSDFQGFLQTHSKYVNVNVVYSRIISNRLLQSISWSIIFDECLFNLFPFIYHYISFRPIGVCSHRHVTVGKLVGGKNFWNLFWRDYFRISFSLISLELFIWPFWYASTHTYTQSCVMLLLKFIQKVDSLKQKIWRFRNKNANMVRLCNIS